MIMTSSTIIKYLTVVIYLGLMLSLSHVTGSKTPPKQLHPKEVTRVLNYILDGYDLKIAPSVDGSPIDVEIGFYIADLVPTELVDLHYTITLYLRQSWRDARLAFQGFDFSNSSVTNRSSTSSSAIPMTYPSSRTSPTPTSSSSSASSSPEELISIPLKHDFISKVWTPDIYTAQMKKSRPDNLLVPIQQVILWSDGTIFFSQKLTMMIYCDMDLSDFPFDKQRCALRVMSYAYYKDEMRLSWMNITIPIVSSPNKNMIEYSFEGFEPMKEEVTFYYGTYDSLLVMLTFKRNINYYLQQIFLPCILIVILSWVGFWIDYRSTPARVALGITTVLTMITFNNSVKDSVPAVGSSKLIDWYLLIAFFFVFMALLEFVIVGIVDSKWNKRKKNMKKNDERELKSRDNSTVTSNNNSIASSPRDHVFANINHGFHSNGLNNGYDGPNLVHRKNNDGTVSIDPTALIFQEFGRVYSMSKKGKFLSTLKNTKKKVDRKLFEKQDQRKREGLHIIDRISRYLYPLSFCLFNVIFFVYAYVRHE